ncbi:MAG: formyltransferase family protein [Desulfosudaceae bacterium]
MKIVFIGTVQSSLLALEKLIAINAGVVAVVTKESSPYNADFADLTLLCEKHGIPFRFTKNINSPEDLEWMRSFAPDVLFCFGFSALLKREILTMAPLGVIGFHPAHLPRNRGRHPIIWALALGLKETAVSFFFMDEGADSGDLLSQELVPISDDDDAQSLYDKIMATALSQIADFVPKLEAGTYQRLKQDHSLANYWRKRNKDDGCIDFRMSSRNIHNLVRALARPYPGAHVVCGGEEYKVWKVKPTSCPFKNFEPGKILSVSEKGIEVKSGDGAVLLQEHNLPTTLQPDEYIQ